MKKLFFVLLVMSIFQALHGNNRESDNREIISTLIPITIGDMNSIKDSLVETHYLTYSAYSDGMIQHALYQDGLVKTILMSTTDKKLIGIQYIFHDGKEISKSSDCSIDPDRPDTVIHVHKKHFVYTSQTEQRIIPRKK